MLQKKVYSTGSLTYGSSSKGYVLKLVLAEESVNTAANTSSVSYKLQLCSGAHNRFDWQLTSALSLGGSQVAASTEEKYLDYNSVWTLLQGQTTVSHGEDGTKSMAFSATVTPYNGGSNYTPPALTLSGTMALTPIARQSTIAASPAFIQDASTIAVGRSSGGYTHSIHYKFGSLSGYLQSADGQVGPAEKKLTATSLVFPIPESFYTQIPDVPSGKCILTCRTYSGIHQIGQAQTAEFTVTADPTRSGPVVTGAAVDIREATVALTGNNKIFVRGRSKVKCTISATPQKSASIKARYVNGTAITGTARTITDMTGAAVELRAVDSRGYETAYTVPGLRLVDYVPVSCTASAKRVDPTSGKATLTVSGKWFSGNFGAVQNSLTVRYRIGGGNWIDIQPAVSGSSYTATAALTNMDYTQSYGIQVQVFDKLDTVTKTVTLGKGLPVFDWGENDFAFHVPVLLQNALPAMGQQQGFFRGDADTVDYNAFFRTYEDAVNCPWGSGILLVLAWTYAGYKVVLQIGCGYNGAQLQYRLKWYELDWTGWKTIQTT